MIIFANNAVTTLATPLLAGQTTLQVLATTGELFPVPGVGEYFKLTIEDRRNRTIEITHCTGRAGDVLTIVRAQEDTTALGFAAGSTVANRFTRDSADAIIAQVTPANPWYLGPFAVAPTLNNEGGPLVAGMQYFNTSSNIFYVWTGASWVDQNNGTNAITSLSGTYMLQDPSVGYSDITDSFANVVSGSFRDNSLVIKDTVTPANDYDGELITAGVFNKFTYSRASTATYVGSDGLIQSAATNIPRIHYNPVTLAKLGYLHEGARTNDLIDSADFTTTWSDIFTTKTANAIASPDGNVTADLLKEDGTTNIHFTNQGIAKAASSLAYSGSVWMKAKERTSCQIRITDQSGNGIILPVNLIAGTSTGLGSQGAGFTATGYKIVAYPNGWYRIEFSVTTNTAVTLDMEIFLCPDADGATVVYAGDNASGLYLWGAQLELGGAASSYIPTTTIAVTRAVDVLSLPDTLFNLTQSAGTLYAKHTWDGGTALSVTGRAALSLDDGTTNELHTLFNYGGVGATTYDGGVGQFALNGGGEILDGVFAKAAFSYSLNDFALTVNGAAAITTGTGTLPSPTKLVVGGYVTGGASLFGTIQEFAFIGQRVSNVVMQRLTGNTGFNGVETDFDLRYIDYAAAVQTPDVTIAEQFLVWLDGVRLKPGDDYTIPVLGTIHFTDPPTADQSFTGVWIALTAAGPQGDPGPEGDPGPQGDPGADGTGLTDGDKGDITVSGTGAVFTIDAQAVTLAKMAHIATGSILGRITAATGVVEVLTPAQVKTLLALVKADVGLGSVDNTSDAGKPVSTAQQTALDLKANLAGPTFTGVPAAPTGAPGLNTTQLATTAFVEAARVILAAADALKANIASPTFTGTPAAPTGAPGLNTTQLATTAFVEAARVILAAADALKANIASPTFTGVPAAPTAAPATNTTQLATTAFVEAARVILAAADATNLATALAADKVVPELADSGATYTLVLTDAGKMVTLDHTSGITLTIPTNASVAFPVNTRIDLLQIGVGQVTVSPTGITLLSSGSKQKLTGQYSGATLWKQSTNTWVLIGDIAT